MSKLSDKVLSGLRCCSEHAVLCPDNCPYDSADGTCLHNLTQDARMLIISLRRDLIQLREQMTPSYYARGWKKLLQKYRADALRNMESEYPNVRWAWWHRHNAQIDMLLDMGLIDDSMHTELTVEWHDEHDPREPAKEASTP